MAKLDEIAELLTEELDGFEKNIGRLEKVNQHMQGLQLRPETAEIDTLLNEYGNHQRKLVEDQNTMMLLILQKVERSIMLPSWAIRLIWALLVCVILVLGFSTYQVSRTSEKEEAAFVKGRDSAMEHFATFLDENQEANELYQKWIKENNKK